MKLIKIQLLLTLFFWSTYSHHVAAQTTDASLHQNVQKLNNYYEALNKKFPVVESLADHAPALNQPIVEPMIKKPTARLIPFEQPQVYQRIGFNNGQRNPFALTTRLLNIDNNVSNSAQFTPYKVEGSLPKMHLRGLVSKGNGELAALLEIQGSDVHLVREGDTVGLHDLGQEMVIRIKKINRLNLVIEAGSLGQVIVVR